MSDQGQVYYRGARSGGKPIVVRSDRSGVRALKRRDRYGLPMAGEFEWGTPRSGAADLALALLWDALGREPRHEVHQEFKWSFVAVWAEEGWAITREEIATWAIDAERAADEREQNIRRNLEEDATRDFEDGRGDREAGIIDAELGKGDQ